MSILAEWAWREPTKAFGWLLGLHLVLWTVLPILVSANLQLDLAEGLALGKEWQLGYWKHPPLPWWITDLLYRIVGDVRAVYLLGPLSVVVCFYAVWRLARLVTGELEALVAVIALEGIHFYNYSAVKFAHDQMQLPFWALTALFYFRALTRGRAVDWLLAGVFLALAFWSKYAAFALAATLGLFLMLDPDARRSWRTMGPWAMAAAFLVVIAPNLWWLVANGFMPFRYVDARAASATSWINYVSFPLNWSAGQFLFILPAIALIAVLFAGSRREALPDRAPHAAFSRRIVTALAIGPFLVTTLVVVLTGRKPVATWGYPLWSLAPLAAILWLGPLDMRRMRLYVASAAAIPAAWVLAYLAGELLEPHLRDRPKATNFPGRVMAETITREWHEKFGTPLVYAAGSEFAVNNLAVYSPDRPHVIVHGMIARSAWIDAADLQRRGAVLIAEEMFERPLLDAWGATFGEVRLDKVLILPRQPPGRMRPARIKYTLVPPKP